MKSIPNSPIIDVADAGSPGLVAGELSSGLKSVCAPVSKSKNSVFVNISKLGSMLNSSWGSETFSCSRTNCDVRFAPRRLKLVAILKSSTASFRYGCANARCSGPVDYFCGEKPNSMAMIERVKGSRSPFVGAGFELSLSSTDG